MSENQPVTIAILSQDAYRALEKKVLNPLAIVDSTTTDVQAGFMLGVQHVLAVLRTGFVSRQIGRAHV